MSLKVDPLLVQTGKTMLAAEAARIYPQQSVTVLKTFQQATGHG